MVIEDCSETVDHDSNKIVYFSIAPSVPGSLNILHFKCKHLYESVLYNFSLVDD